MIFRPPRLVALFLCAVGAAVLVGVGFALLSTILLQPVTAATFALGLALALSIVGSLAFAWALFAQLRLRYTLGREGLVLDSAAGRTIIPVRAIERVQWGAELLGAGFVGRLANWLPWLGPLANPRLGRAERYTPVIVEGELALVRTLEGSFLIALDRRSLERFLDELPRRQSLARYPAGGIVESPADLIVEPLSAGGVRRYPSELARLAHWDDRLTHVLALAAVVANAALYAFVCVRYGAIPEFVPMHFNSAGLVDYVGTRADVWRLPVIGSATFGLNFLLGTLAPAEDRFLARVLLLAALVVQALLLVALFYIAAPRPLVLPSR